MQFHIPAVLEFDNSAFRDVISQLLPQRERERERERKKEREKEREKEKQVNAVSTISLFVNKKFS